MPRRLRFASGGYVYHVLNRAVARDRIFAEKRDYEAFESVLFKAKQRVPIRLLAWSVLPNHWHLVLWPRGDEGKPQRRFVRGRTAKERSA